MNEVRQRIYNVVNSTSRDWCGRERSVEEIANLLDYDVSTIYKDLKSAINKIEKLKDRL